MFSFIEALVNPPKVGQSYKVVEVDKRLQSSRSDKEIQESVATLGAHPGFIWLTQRLDVQNASLKAKLVNERHANLEEVQFLQAGVYWSQWLRQEVARATARPIDRKVDPFDEELAAFKEIDAQIERVGA